MRFLGFFLLCLLSWESAFGSTGPITVPHEAVLAGVGALLERFDGEALLVKARRTGARPDSWRSTLRQLEAEESGVGSVADIVRLFRRLDLAFTSLHSRFEPGPVLSAELPTAVMPVVQFQAEWTAAEQTRFRIAEVGPELHSAGDEAPLRGDELLAINGRSLEEWSQEHFEFCKFPLRPQCDVLLPNQFFREVLSWNRKMPLVYRLKRGARTWETSIPTQLRPGVDGPIPQPVACGEELDAYPGFTLAYQGNRACVYRSDTDAKTALLRITSFAYSDLPASESIRTVRQEVKRLLPWWQAHATWDHLVIDLTNNTGGYAPIGYYQLLFQKPFQEQWVQFRKSRLLADPAYRAKIFWESRGQELWFQSLVRSGAWDRAADGEFLPPVPMFCAEESENCAQARFRPYAHPFTGRVSLIVNQFCISSCDAFAFTVKEELGDRVRVIGQPHAADTSYARMAADVYLDSSASPGYRIQLRAETDEPDPQALFRQTFVVSRSVRGDGSPVAGKPLALDRFVPLTLENAEGWQLAALEAALGL